MVADTSYRDSVFRALEPHDQHRCRVSLAEDSVQLICETCQQQVVIDVVSPATQAGIDELNAVREDA